MRAKRGLNFTVKNDVADCSKTSMHLYHITWGHIQEDNDVLTPHRNFMAPFTVRFFKPVVN
jgi:hypothetical protein